MSEHLTGVGYLEDTDVDSKGNLINKGIPKNIPSVLMIYASWCPACKACLNQVQEFADKNQGKVCVLAIQADDQKPSVQALAKRIKSFYPEFRGYPTFLAYNKGKMVKEKELQERSVSGLEDFAFSN